MIRTASLSLLLTGALFAQAPEKPNSNDLLATLRINADMASANWDALAKALEPKIARLLPCDPNSRAAVEEVSHASDARLSTLSSYLKAAVAKAKSDTEAAKRVLAAQASLSGGWNTEKAEADQQVAAIDAQFADLKESMRVRSTLAGAEQVLAEIERMVKERSAKAGDLAGRKDVLNALVGDLVVGYQERQTALEKESAQLEVEIARWSFYYTSRLSRAVTECAVINNPGGTAPRKKQP